MAVEIKNKQYRELAEALAIFDRYMPEGEYGEFHAEHDQIWAGPNDYEAVSPEDIARLEELGWYPDEGNGSGFYAFT
jgi:hypothetical protein